MPELLHMRTSERRSMRTCVQKWWWNSVEGLQSKRPATALWLGSAIHESLATWYQPGLKRQGPMEDPFLAYLEEQVDVATPVRNEDDELEYVSAKELGLEMLRNYQKEYGLDEHWQVLATEQPFQVTLPKPKNSIRNGRPVVSKRAWMKYVGQIDGVYRDLRTNEIWLMEHKTAAQIITHHLPLDDQAGSYWAVATSILRKAGIIGPKEELAGIMYNFLRKAKADERPRNADGFVTNKPVKQDYIDALVKLVGQETEWTATLPKMSLNKLIEVAAEQNLPVFGAPSANQPPENFLRFPVYRSKGERKNMIERIQHEGRFKEAYLAGTLPVLKNPGRDCNMCQFFTLCQLDETGDQVSVEEYKQLQFRVVDPYAAHRKKES